MLTGPGKSKWVLIRAEVKDEGRVTGDERLGVSVGVRNSGYMSLI